MRQTRRNKTRKNARVAKVSKPVQQAIVKAVKRVNPGELKFASTWNGSMISADVWGVQYNSAMTGGSNVGLLPNIPQGDNNGERNGNRITPRRLVVDFWVTAANLDNNLDFIARLLILQSRNQKNQTLVTSVPLTTLLDWGQTQGGFVGYTSHLSAPINKDEFQVLMDRKVVIDKTYGQNPSSGNSYTSTAVGQSTNLIHHIRVSLKPPSVLHYANGVATLPEGYAPFFNCGYVQPSRQASDTPDTTISALQVYFTSTLYYTDA